MSAFLVTDVAPFFWASHDHAACDTADRLDYERLGLTSAGVTAIACSLANT